MKRPEYILLLAFTGFLVFLTAMHYAEIKYICQMSLAFHVDSQAPGGPILIPANDPIVRGKK